MYVYPHILDPFSFHQDKFPIAIPLFPALPDGPSRLDGPAATNILAHSLTANPFLHHQSPIHQANHPGAPNQHHHHHHHHHPVPHTIPPPPPPHSRHHSITHPIPPPQSRHHSISHPIPPHRPPTLHAPYPPPTDAAPLRAEEEEEEEEEEDECGEEEEEEEARSVEEGEERESGGRGRKRGRTDGGGRGRGNKRPAVLMTPDARPILIDGTYCYWQERIYWGSLERPVTALVSD